MLLKCERCGNMVSTLHRILMVDGRIKKLCVACYTKADRDGEI